MAPSGGFYEECDAPRVKLTRTINTGSTSTVYEGLHLHTDERVAVKWVPRSPKADAIVWREVRALQQCSHPNIARLVDFAVWPTHCQVIQELVDGGDLFDFITSKKKFTETRAIGILTGVLEALAYLHDCKNMAHRDIKLENICLSPRGVPKLIDFGFAGPAGEHTFNCPGTTEYISPEMLSARATRPCLKKADMWGCGILAFSLLTAHTTHDFPWKRADESSPEYVDYAHGDIAQRPWGVWQLFSAPARLLLSKLLAVEPSQRFTARQALDFIRETWPCTARARRRRHTPAPAPPSFDAPRLSMLFGDSSTSSCRTRDTDADSGVCSDVSTSTAADAHSNSSTPASKGRAKTKRPRKRAQAHQPSASPTLVRLRVREAPVEEKEEEGRPRGRKRAHAADEGAGAERESKQQRREQRREEKSKATVSAAAGTSSSSPSVGAVTSSDPPRPVRLRMYVGSAPQHI